jgi:hypothetical protein
MVQAWAAAQFTASRYTLRSAGDRATTVSFLRAQPHPPQRSIFPSRIDRACEAFPCESAFMEAA